MPRPRAGKFASINERYGMIFLSRDVLDEILEIAKSEGYSRSSIYLGGEFKNGELVLWVSPQKNHYTCKLQVVGVRKTVFIKSRRLARIAGEGRKKVKIHR